MIIIVCDGVSQSKADGGGSALATWNKKPAPEIQVLVQLMKENYFLFLVFLFAVFLTTFFFVAFFFFFAGMVTTPFK